MKSAPLIDLGELASTAVLDQLREGIIVTDRAGAIRFVNDAAREMHGVAELDVEPRDYSERYHLFTVDGQPHPFAELPLARAVSGETVTEAAWIIRRPDGTEIYAVGTAKPLLAANGEQSGAVLTIRDETEGHRIETELRRSEETVRALFETAGIYTAVVEVGEDDFHLVMGNGRMAAALGLDKLDGQTGRSLLGAGRVREIMPLLGAALESSEPTIIEYPWPLDGAPHWFVATFSTLRSAPRRLFLASIDITRRKAAERELASALKMKDVLLHEVNHRVKNSLQMVSAMLSLQERTGDAALADSLREARGRVDTIARVHEQLYTTSAHDRVEVVGYLEDLLTDGVANVGGAGKVRYEFHHQGERLELGVQHAVPLALIMVEMAVNAAKYAFPDGREGVVRVETELTATHLLLTIADDGVGLEPDAMAKGTGLGKRIVRSLSTQLQAQTTYLARDAGTTFRLSMPLPAHKS
jgi:PAS domain S-box-containing protein